MKHRITTLTLFLASLTSAIAQNTKLYEQASDYFSGKPTKPSSTRLRNFKSDSLTIWSAWKNYIGQPATNSLRALEPLSDKACGCWTIPDSLEPNARLNYYYGTKGDSKHYPLFLYIHGSGPRDAEWATGLRICSSFDDKPSAYFIPQIPQEGAWYRWYQRSKQWFIKRLLRQAMATDNIDPYRLYLFGISEGGYGSQRLASFYADYLAAAGPMAGGEPLKNAPIENCGNIGFSLLTGEKDYGFYRDILTTYTMQAFDSIQSLYPKEYNHRIKLLPGMGHGIDYSLTTPWLKNFKRNPTPSHFIWEDFEMDNRHRNGFYNIAVSKRPNDTLRTRYEFTAKDNVVRLNIENVEYTCIQKDPQWGIEMKFTRNYSPATQGKITIYLSNTLVNLRKTVTIYINNKQMFKGKPRLSTTAMMQSLQTFGDPLRIYPASITLDY